MLLIAVLYCIAMGAMFPIVIKYIQSKDSRLKLDLYNQIVDAFHGKEKVVYVDFSNASVSYESVSMPNVSESAASVLNFEKEKARCEEQYGDLIKLYRIKTDPNEWRTPNIPEAGWQLIMLHPFYPDGFCVTWVYPYAVGYKKNSYNYYPSVKDAVDNAFDFYTQKDTYYSKDLNKGNANDFFMNIRFLSNEYYRIEEQSMDYNSPGLVYTGAPLFEQYVYDGKRHATQNGYMYNDFYKVFIAAIPRSYTIGKWGWEPDIQNRNKLWIVWSIILTMFFIVSEIILGMINKRQTAIEKETLYQKLVRLCNPSNYIDNYNKEKIDKANDIYKQLMEMSPDDEVLLNTLLDKAVEELEITLIDTKVVNKLKSKINPKNFMNPYNAEKVTLANELFSVLSKDNLTYKEFLEVKSRSESLFK